MGQFIGTIDSENPEKLSVVYSLIDGAYGIDEDVTTYSPEIWKKEGAGIDKFVKYVQTHELADAPTIEAVGRHMYENYINLISSL